ncbi:hypothetical protein [Deferrisoma camini]|uniref:hypothetical protein n=1 Tax=Deferrisoma camini TaxID=1035120 RepID=UPI00046CD91C|nr:hypothetical protein [Deferrisoma camini]
MAEVQTLTFSSWSDVRDRLRNDLVNRDLTVARYRLPDGKEVQCRTVQELGELLALVDRLAAEEAGTAPRRVSLKVGSGGTW